MTELARMGYVRGCLHQVTPADPGTQVLVYSTCSQDAHQLDRNKLNSELAALDPAVRFSTKLEFSILKQQVAAVETELRKNGKLAALAFDEPHKIAAEWHAFSEANQSTVQAVREVELIALDKGESNDCARALSAPWKQALRAVVVDKTRPPSYGLAETRFGYFVGVGMVRCSELDESVKPLRASIAEALYLSPLDRGPRTAAYEAVHLALAKSKVSASVPRMEAYELAVLPIAQAAKFSPQFAAYTISAIKKRGDQLHLTFKKEWHDTVVCTREEPTDRWRFNGRNELERISHCTSTRPQRYLATIEPADIPAALGSWLKPGMAVVLGVNHGPTEIWDSAAHGKLLGLFGVPLAK
jgi:hypothetical protein